MSSDNMSSGVQTRSMRRRQVELGYMGDSESECSICYEACNENFALCNTCPNDDDRMICDDCWAKLLKIRGLEMDASRVNIYITCPFCRQEITENEIRSSEFSYTYDFLQAIKALLTLATNVLSAQRNFFRDEI